MLKAFEFADSLLDADAPFADRAREEAWLVFVIGLMRNNWDDAA